MRSQNGPISRTVPIEFQAFYSFIKFISNNIYLIKKDLLPVEATQRRLLRTIFDPRKDHKIEL